MTDYSTVEGQKRLMAESMELPSETYISKTINVNRLGDYGSDPIGNSMVRMVPSGDVVTAAESIKRLKAARKL